MWLSTTLALLPFPGAGLGPQFVQHTLSLNCFPSTARPRGGGGRKNLVIAGYCVMRYDKSPRGGAKKHHIDQERQHRRLRDIHTSNKGVNTRVQRRRRRHERRAAAKGEKEHPHI